jgi:hypothetical protein
VELADFGFKATLYHFVTVLMAEQLGFVVSEALFAENSQGRQTIFFLHRPHLSSLH